MSQTNASQQQPPSTTTTTPVNDTPAVEAAPRKRIKISAEELQANEQHIKLAREKIPLERPVEKLLGNFIKAKEKEKVVLLASGSFSPIHNGHIAMMRIAKDYLEKQLDKRVLVGYFSAIHDKASKKPKYLAYHRIQMLKLVTKNSSWMDVDTWEAAQNKSMGSAACANKMAQYLNEKMQNPQPAVKVVLVCGMDVAKKLSNFTLDKNVMAIVVSTSKNKEELTKLQAQLKTYDPPVRMDFCVDDTLPETITSTQVRQMLKDNSTGIENLVPKSIVSFVKKHNLTVELNRDLFTEEEKQEQENNIASSK